MADFFILLEFSPFVIFFYVVNFDIKFVYFAFIAFEFMKHSYSSYNSFYFILIIHNNVFCFYIYIYKLYFHIHLPFPSHYPPTLPGFLPLSNL